VLKGARVILLADFILGFRGWSANLAAPEIYL
jgi:hypothetical protein